MYVLIISNETNFPSMFDLFICTWEKFRTLWSQMVLTKTTFLVVTLGLAGSIEFEVVRMQSGTSGKREDKRNRQDYIHTKSLSTQ